MREKKFHVKTVKLRGQVSQGIAIPLSIIMKNFPNLSIDGGDGFDMTKQLGVKKYEPVLPANSHAIGFPPGYIERTNEIRAQVMLNLFRILATIDLLATIKVDGTSSTYFLKDGEFGVYSHRQQLGEYPGCNYWKMAHKYGIEERLRKYGG